MSKFSNLFKMGGESSYSKTVTMLISLIGLVVIFIAWYLIAAFEVIPTKILPDPISVVSSYGYLFTDNHLLANTWFSIKLNLSCYIWALLVTIPLGFFIGLYPINNIVIGRYIDSVRYLPIPALSGIFIAIAGLTFSLKVLFLSVGIGIYILPAICNKINELQNPNNDDEFVYLQSIKTLGATPWQKFREVYFPYVMGSITGDIINLTGISWSYLTIAELLYKDGTTNGIGALINVMTRQAHMDAVYALLFLIVVIGILQDVIFKSIDKKLFPWKY